MILKTNTEQNATIASYLCVKLSKKIVFKKLTSMFFFHKEVTIVFVN